MIVLIPSYEPGDRLVPLVTELRRRAPEASVVVVDDGSGPEFRAVFDAVEILGATVLHTPRNGGKAAALRTGFGYVLKLHPGQDVVTADSDGQHTVTDILAVAARTAEPAADPAVGRPLVLGSRAFDTEVPRRSRIGNRISSALFRYAAGYPVRDTQTGLRGIPAERIAWAFAVPGERFAYELEVLLACRGAGVPVVEVPIETVYLEHNSSSHFRPVVDSLRVMRPMLRYLASSLAGFTIDLLLLSLLTAFGAPLLAAVVGARLVSASVNFTLNRRFVFGVGGRDGLAGQLAQYGMLAAVILAVNYLALAALTRVGVPLLPAKLAVEVALFLGGFAVQRAVVFARHTGRTGFWRSRTAPRVTRRRPVLRTLVAAGAVLTLVGCGVVTETTSATTGTESVAVASSEDFWDSGTVHTIEITESDTLDELVATYLSTGEKEWGSVTVTIDGTVFTNVGIKLKGNSTLRSVDTDTALSELPWIIRLDKYVDEQSYQGETRFVIRGNSSETSLNEAIALALLDASGLAAENAAAVRVTVGDEEASLRLVVNDPTGDWADVEFESTGQLYKALSDGDGNYHGDDPADYEDIWDQKGGDDDYAALIEFLQFVNESDDATFEAELGEHLDIEAFARYLAFQDLVDNFDDIDGPGNNWYLYIDDSTGIATVVNWDLNLAFGASAGGGGGGQGGNGPGNGGNGNGGGQRQGGGENAQGGSRSGSNTLVTRFTAVAAFATLIEEAQAQLQEELVDSGLAEEIITTWQTTLTTDASDLVSASTIASEADAIRSKLGLI